MREPSIRGSRQAIAAVLAAAMLIGGGGFLLGRFTASAPKIPTVVPAPTQPPRPEPVAPPVHARTFGRADLIDLARLAANAHVMGREMPQSVMDAAGQRFELALPFGCSGPSTETSSGSMGWEANQETGVLRIRAKPETWSANDWFPQLQDKSLVGFWIERPWAYNAQCPAQTPSPAREEIPSSPAEPEHTLAIAQFGSGEARTAQRGFEKVERIGPGGLEISAGLMLRLTGKLSRSEQGAPVRCVQPAGPVSRPKCIIVAIFEEVRIENAATGDVLGVWDERSVQR